MIIQPHRENSSETPRVAFRELESPVTRRHELAGLEDGSKATITTDQG